MSRTKEWFTAYEQAREDFKARQAARTDVFDKVDARRTTSVECHLLSDHEKCFLNMRFHHFECMCKCHIGEPWDMRK